MSGQFPNRLAPSGPFTETVDDAGLGGLAFTRHVVFPAEDVEVDGENTAIDVVLDAPIPLTPGHEASYDVRVAFTIVPNGLYEAGRVAVTVIMCDADDTAWSGATFVRDIMASDEGVSFPAHISGTVFGSRVADIESIHKVRFLFQKQDDSEFDFIVKGLQGEAIIRRIA